MDCKRCGKCCSNLTIDISAGDVLRWHNEGRDDILDCLVGIFQGVDAWFHPVTGEELEKCPFLRKVPGKPIYKCRIQDTKPFVCRSYKPGTCVGYK